jgi:5-methylcytosine-specific restriction endonuclease McrA
MSKTVDHTIERQDGGPLLDLTNAYSMHKRCNESKGSRRWHQRKTQHTPASPLHIDPTSL